MSGERAGTELFVYGSLMVPEVLEVVLGRVLALDEAILDDHVRRRLHGVVYPGLVPRRGERVEGRVVAGLGKSDLQRLDAFEGDLYQRTPCVVEVEGERAQAFAYIVRPAHRGRIAPQEWSLDDFVARQLSAYLEGCRLFAERYVDEFDAPA